MQNPKTQQALQNLKLQIEDAKIKFNIKTQKKQPEQNPDQNPQPSNEDQYELPKGTTIKLPTGQVYITKVESTIKKEK